MSTDPIRLAVIGTGMMARIRTQAFLSTGRIELCGIASRSKRRAQNFARSFGDAFATDQYDRMAQTQPDVVLIEVPHDVQGAMVSWALDQKCHVLIGGCFAYSIEEASQIIHKTQRTSRIVESGYEARYKAVWATVKQMIDAGRLGRISLVQSLACWKADPDSWYYDQQQSGGMPLTHMTYAFINPVRWLLGTPTHVHAVANRIGAQQPGMVDEVSCAVNMSFPDDVIGHFAASYIHHGKAPTWRVTIVGTKGIVEMQPSEMGNGSYRVFWEDGSTTCADFEGDVDGFRRQADAFLDTIEGLGSCQNGPLESFEDVAIAEAIVRSVRMKKTMTIETRTFI